MHITYSYLSMQSSLTSFFKAKDANTTNNVQSRENLTVLDEYEPDAAIYHWLNSGKGNKHLNGHALSV